MLDKCCIYCGRTNPDSDDHVPPRNIFVSTPKSLLLKVPSCKKCNRAFSRDDEYFMVFLTVISNTTKNSYKDALFEKVKRIRLRPESQGFYQSFLDSREARTVLTDSGLWLLNQPGLNIDQSRIRKTLDRIVYAIVYLSTGLYCSSILSILTTDYEQMNSEMVDGLAEVLAILAQSPTIPIHDGKIFKYKFVYPKAIPKVSACILTFFETYHAVAIAEHQDENSPGTFFGDKQSRDSE